MTDPERFREIEALFLQALRQPARDRASFVAEHSAGDHDLMRSVQQLLAADERAGEGFDRLRPFEQDPRDRNDRDAILGQRIGPWCVLEKVADGGMGVVYRARRSDGLYDQEVALKLLRIETASEESLRRFDLERQLLARLEHPGIARMIDGGRSAAGTPYFTMEFVDGKPIHRWCAEHSLDLQDRLRLFAQVCTAVHHAHVNLVLHRDLKPSNILVDAHGRARLVDFGIGRALDDGREAATLTGARALTPAYASPEQLLGRPLSTSTDIYSLGVVLFELVTGRRPWQREGRSPAEWERIITQEAPLLPSTAVKLEKATTEGGGERFCRGLPRSPAQLHRQLRGDVDRIVMMAMHRAAERRYATAELLAEDIQRFLAGRPVLARGDSTAYLLRRFVARNALAVSAALLVFLSLSVGMATAWISRQGALEAAELARVESQKAQEAAVYAEIEADSAQRASELLVEVFLNQPIDDEMRQRLSAAVDEQAAVVRRTSADRAQLRANVLDALGQVQEYLGMLVHAEALFDEARGVRAAHFGADSVQYSMSLRNLGRLAYLQGKFTDARGHFERRLAIQRASPTQVHVDVSAAANDLATVQRSLGELDSARDLHLEALALRRKADPGGRSVAESLHNLARVQMDRGQIGLAMENLAEAAAIREQVLGEAHGLTLQSRSGLAILATNGGDFERAEQELRRVLAGYAALGQVGEQGRVQTLCNLAQVQLSAGQLDVAEQTLRSALDASLASNGSSHPTTLKAWSRIATLQKRRGDHGAARESLEEVLRVQLAQEPRPVPAIAESLVEIALSFAEEGGLRDAHERLLEAEEFLLHCETDAGPIASRVESLLMDIEQRLDDEQAGALLDEMSESGE